MNLKTLFSGDRILVPILLLAAIIRIQGLYAAPFFDEAWWVLLLKNMLNGQLVYTTVIPHPPISVMLYYFFVLVGGISIPVVRFMPLVVGLLTVATSYFFAKSLYGKREAVLASLFMAFIFYPVWMSLFIDVDGNVLALFSLLTLFAFHKTETTKKRWWLIAGGVFLGLAFLSKYSAVLLVPALLLYDAVSCRLKNLKPIILMTAIGIAVFALFPLATLVAGTPGMFTDTLNWGSGNLGRADSSNIVNAYLLSVSRLVIFVFQYGTPIFFFFPLYFLFRSKFEKRDWLLISYLAVVLVFFTFVISGGPKARYIMFAVPALALVSARCVSLALPKPTRNNVILSAVAVFSTLVVMATLNLYGTQEAFNSQNLDLGLLIKNSMFWYSGFASVPFAIHVHSLAFVAAVALALFVLSLKFGTKPLIALFSVGLAFNFFVLAQSFYPTFSPDYTGTMNEITAYYKENLNCTAYFTEKAFALYLNGTPVDYNDSPPVSGCLIALNVQDISVSPKFRAFADISKCNVLRTFGSNGFAFGYVYACG